MNFGVGNCEANRTNYLYNYAVSAGYRTFSNSMNNFINLVVKDPTKALNLDSIRLIRVSGVFLFCSISVL